MTEVYLKNMVCPRCIMAVERLLQDEHITYKNVKLGSILWDELPSSTQMEKLVSGLQQLGFEFLEDKNSQIIEKVKVFLINLIQNKSLSESFVLSDEVSKHLNKEYSTISKLFSQVESITLEHYFINLKISKAKELLKYNEMSVSEIAFELGYKNVSHLSSQFKKEVGLSPVAFRLNYQRMKER
ncbi:MAG TPA: AraC family transcriptional regulator [Saprospiraceae bacterium]|nr:AraC family transcriptional regulator [Saprospiraceae bacterium]